MNDLTILHLSDLHISEGGGTYSELLKALLADIKQQVETFPNANLVLVITGDIIFQGKKGAVGNAKSFFKDLKGIIGNRLADLFIVPGNHDKCRTTENKFLIPAYRSYYESKCSAYSEELRKKSKDEKKDTGFDDSFYEHLWTVQEEAYKESGYKELLKYIYTELFRDFSHAAKIANNTFGVHVLENGGNRYCFVLFNTAWSCVDDSDNRHLLIGDFQLKRIKAEYDELKGDKQFALTLAMGHHPLNCLYGSEQDEVFDKLIFREGIRSEIYMCGHNHDRSVINWSNTDHTMYTLMTGIGWPDKSSASQQYHYYSIYNFNLDLNSMEIYVRSTRDTVFRADLSIYGGGENDTQLVRAIRPNRQQAVMPINVAKGLKQKKLFPSSVIMEEVAKFSQVINKMSTAAQKMLYNSVSDFLNNMVLNESEEEDAVVDAIIQSLVDRYDKLTDDADDELLQDDKLLDILRREKNKIAIYNNFTADLLRLCQYMKEELLKEKDREDVCFCFRYLSDKTSYKYSILCSSFQTEIASTYITSPNDTIAFDGVYENLLERAYNDDSAKCLVYSANMDLCKPQLGTYGEWQNIITIVPDFEENKYTKKVSRNNYKHYPRIVFDVMTKSHQFDYLLYLFDFFRFNDTLGDFLKPYVRCFSINIDEYCTQYRRR